MALISLIAGYVILEAGFRLYTYVKYVKATGSSGLVVAYDRDIHAFDSATGVRYQPSLRANVFWLGGSGEVLKTLSFQTDPEGRPVHRADRAGTPGAFRITVLGDSFTAGSMSNDPWPGLLEDVLNADPEVALLTGGRPVEVVNLARDAMGILHFEQVFRHEVEGRGFDAVIVAPISDDLYRKLNWRAFAALRTAEGVPYRAVFFCGRPEDVAQPLGRCSFSTTFVATPEILADQKARAAILRDMVALQVAALPWWEPYPNLLAKLLRRALGIGPGDHLRDNSFPAYPGYVAAYDDAAAAMERINKAHPRVLNLHLPTYSEIESGGPIAPVAGWLKLLADRGLTVQSIIGPLKESLAGRPTASLFNLPYDGHPSDEGAASYARAVAGLVKADLRARPAVAR